jgi:phospholipid transport system substrate-binding protein
MVSIKIKSLIMVLLLVCAFPALGSETLSPFEMITTSIDLLEIELGDEENKKRLKENRAELYSIIDQSLSPYFHKRYAGRLVLDQHWAGANGEQRRRFTEGLYQSLVESYAITMLNFDISKINVLPLNENLQNVKKTTIKSEVDYKGELIPMNFKFGKFKEGWFFYDVRIEGVSYVKNYRNQYGAEIQENGLESVIIRLEN